MRKWVFRIRRTEAVDQRDGAGAGRAMGLVHLPDQMRYDYAVDDAQHLAQGSRIRGEQETQQVGKLYSTHCRIGRAIAPRPTTRPRSRPYAGRRSSDRSRGTCN